MTVKVLPPVGTIPLSEKLKPICELPAPYEGPVCVTRGLVDVSGWKSRFASLPEGFWKDENQTGNVKLIRPAHDAWGIEKIVFTFCDDFLQRVYDLPYSQHPDWKPLLTSVYSALQINEGKVVRSLLASMPAGVKIPVHHDTGYWVRHTHRVHVAIETGEEVEFWVGTSADNMQQYDFEEGRIVELNNQAKHAVNNLMKDKPRIHLIFDYVDDDFVLPERVQLTTDDVILQTRRSIDLKRDVMNYQVENSQPRFIIIGAQKAGTTSLYEYLCQHPLVVKGKRRETHYFDWRFNHNLSVNDIAGHRNYYMNFFEKDVLKSHPSLITGESTPSYLLHSQLVLPRLKLYAPWAKLIVVLRNPAERAYSQFEMIIDPSGTPEQLKNRGRSHYANKSFEDVIKDEMDELKRNGINEHSSFTEFQEKIIATKPMDHGGHSILFRGLYCFQIEHYLAEWPRDQLLFLSIKQLKQRESLEKCLKQVFEFINIPYEEISDVEAKNKRSYQNQMAPETKQLLEDFYRPYNERLFQVLGQQIDW